MDELAQKGVSAEELKSKLNLLEGYNSYMYAVDIICPCGGS